ncbi:hypothetical protein [Cellulomonas phragmiteti]|uniref:Uncharacterized protein n=1 Tax=Cellulomonas phragmiteti TaxID=478780 RepID=A0ABQ4DMU0_9CELL|nr:hypothetical protein [Cellulomonas phragmiteti]GIG40668.1 hypothetical protein Cph01nite_24300 [Cellulomonas phragmiteti]
MSVPDDTVTPTPDEVPDPVEATAPQADPAPGENEAGQEVQEPVVKTFIARRDGIA